MRRKWAPYDQETLKGEFKRLPTADFHALTFAMENYRDDTGIKYKIDNYGSGILMIKGSGRNQGRCLFFSEEVKLDDGGEKVQQVVMLRAFKKEGQKAPKSEIELAKTRRNEYLARKKK